MVDQFSAEDPQKNEADIIAVYMRMTPVELLEVAAAFCRDGDRALREGNVTSFSFCLGRLVRIEKIILEWEAGNGN